MRTQADQWLGRVDRVPTAAAPHGCGIVDVDVEVEEGVCRGGGGEVPRRLRSVSAWKDLGIDGRVRVQRKDGTGTFEDRLCFVKTCEDL